MNVLKESAELRELWQAMDIVIGETPTSPQAPEQATPTQARTSDSDDNIQPILDRIERREKQRKYSARLAA